MHIAICTDFGKLMPKESLMKYGILPLHTSTKFV